MMHLSGHHAADAATRDELMPTEPNGPSPDSIAAGRCAEALARFTEDQTVPILDYGCGTGASGLTLKLAGFKTVDGVDTSQTLVQEATQKRIYRNVAHVEPATALPWTPGTYGAVVAAQFKDSEPQHAVLHMLLQGLAPGEKLAFTLTDRELENPANEAALNEWLDCGAACLLLREHGPHAPDIDLNSNVYIIEKN